MAASSSRYKVYGTNSRVPAPVKIQIGQRNIKASATGSAAVLGRQMQAAFDTLGADLAHFFRQLEGALPQDMEAALEPTLELAQEYCPKDTEVLVNSAYLATESYRGGARAEIGFAKNSYPDYAVYVHEMPYQHEEPTSDKFMQRAIDEDYYQILDRVTRRVRVRLGT